MIVEKMIELFVLSQVISGVGDYDSKSSTLKFQDKLYDGIKLNERYTNLLKEFLESYVIESDSKE